MFGSKKIAGLNGCILILILLILNGHGSVSASEPAKDSGGKISIKMVGTAPLQHHLTKGLEMYKDSVMKKSGGQVEMEIYPAQQLYNEKDLVNALPKGAVEGALFNPDFWAGLVRSEGPMFFPAYYKDRALFYRFFESEAWEIVKKEFEEKGNVKVLSMAEVGVGGLISKKPVAKMDDFKGLRTRSYGEYIAVFLQSVGSAPVVMSAGDMYLALQRGTIDAALTSMGGIMDRKLFEVGKYYLDKDTSFSTPFLLGFNLDFWKKLPPSIQKVLTEAGFELQEWSRTFTLQSDDNYKKALREKGITFTVMDPKEWDRIREKVAPDLEAAYKKNVGEEKGQQILNIIRKTCF